MPSFAHVGARRICFEDGGDPQGLPVFSLHGTPGCRLNRYPDDERIAATGARLITYDRPGYGRSDRNHGRSVVDCVGDVAAIADQLGIDRFAITGGSGGGPHCLAVAAALPERVLRVRCVVGVAPYPAPGLDWFAGMDAANVTEFGWALEGEERLDKELQREAVQMRERVAKDPSTFLAGFELSPADREALAHPVTQQVFRVATEEMFLNGVGGWVDDDLAFTRPWGFDPTQIRVPVEVWYGETDVLVPAAHGRWLAENIPNAEVHVDRQGGHMTHPDKTLEHLRLLVEAARR